MAGEGGSATLELVVLVPGLLALLLLVIAAGRISAAGGQVEEAARDSARAASLERGPAAAAVAARLTATRSLAAEHVTCQHLLVDVTGGFDVPAGQPAAVRVTLSCTADLSDLALPGLPGTRTERASYAAVLDTYRGR